MRTFLHNVFFLGLTGLVACSQTVTPPPLRSLARSERVSLLCREKISGEGRDMRACPDPDDAITDDAEQRHTMALVTQATRGEVAVIDLHDNVVIDEDPSLPGNEFLSVGANPTSIVSTPGGIATFVGTAEPGLEAIFALPTSCITAPNPDVEAGQRRTRELTLWSSCRLPSRPGELRIITDPSGSTAPAANGSEFRASCPLDVATTALGDEAAASAEVWRASAIGEGRHDCPAELALEEQITPAGRRKLLVTLPDMGLVAIYDAQAILNQPAGTFGACVPDRVIALRDTLPVEAIEQPLPPDLIDPRTNKQTFTYDKSVIATDPSWKAQPAGVAVSTRDGKTEAYLADVGVPLIHALDLTNPCAPIEEAPLRPLAYDNPSRAVFTNELSVSIRTLTGQAKGVDQRFLYATDHGDNTVMIFDLGSGSRAPVLRPHFPELPFEPADRIRFSTPVKKIQLFDQDAPALDTDARNTSEEAIWCDPYPGASVPGSLYRTALPNYDKGAGPRKFRGIFGAIALDNGQIAAIDVEDWDAPCRRPDSNAQGLAPGQTVDWLGCSRDDKLPAGESFVDQGVATVSDESSCNVIEPHRLRSSRLFKTDSTLGTSAPSLVALPRLGSPQTGDLPTGKSDTGRKHPQLLAVPFVDTPAGSTSASPGFAFLNVGTTRYEQCESGRTCFDVDPALATGNSLLLPLVEPRVYSAQETFSVTYEGAIGMERPSGQLPYFRPGEYSDRFGRATGEDELVLVDPDAWYCDQQGVQDLDYARAVAKDEFRLAPAAAEAFAQGHSDFVVLTADFDPNDPYFSDQATATQCAMNPGLEGTESDFHGGCEALFGTKKEPAATREFAVTEAHSGYLYMKARQPVAANSAGRTWTDTVHCCFPTVHSYVVRGGKQWVVRGSVVMHQVTKDPTTSRCVRDTTWWKSKLRNRAYEIASSAETCKTSPDKPVADQCAIGAALIDPATSALAADEVCVTDQANGGIAPSRFGTSAGLASTCLFDSLKSRFAIYRGQEPSTRDMAFKWAITGGFSALATSISSASVGLNVIPTDLVYARSIGAFVVIDGASGGVNLVGVGSFAPLRQPFL